MQNFLKSLLLTTLVLFCYAGAHSQHQLGMRLEHEAGINSISLNPSSLLASTSKWDIQLVSLGLFFDNNYTYLKNTNLISVLSHTNDMRLVFEQRATSPNEFEVDFGRGVQKRFINSNAFVAGPGLAYRINESQSIALFTQFRSVLGANSIPAPYSYYNITNRPFGQPFQINQFNTGLMNWVEVGLSYAQSFELKGERLDLGLSVKYLRGSDAVFLRSKRDYDHTVTGQNDFTITGSSFDYGYTPLQGLFTQAAGRGGSFDLGFTYYINTFNSGYKWRIGVSLNDIGLINFKNINRISLETSSTLSVLGNDYLNADYSSGLDSVTNLFVQNAIGNTNPDLVRSNSALLFAPTTLVTTADYRWNKKLYVNGLLALPLVGFDWNGARNGSLLAITPRWQDKNFTISTPITLYQFRNVNLGLAARISYFTIGSERLSSILFKRDFAGTDLYTSLKIPIGRLTTGGKRMGRRVKGSLECYPM